MTRTPPNLSAALAVLLQLHDRDFSSIFRKRTPVKLIRFQPIFDKTSLGERKQKKVDFSRGGGGGGSFTTFELCCVRHC